MGQVISLNTRHGRVSAWRSAPPNKAKGAVVIAHEIYGLTQQMRQMADRFATLGYITLVPALYDRVHPGAILPYDEEGTAKGWTYADDLGIDGALDAIRGAYDHVVSENRVAIVGYGWGGTVAMLANMRINIPAVCYYGSRNRQYLSATRTKAPLLLHFAEHDRYVTPEDVAQHRDWLPNAEINVWPGREGFANDQLKHFHPESNAEAMTRTSNFLRKHLQQAI